MSDKKIEQILTEVEDIAKALQALREKIRAFQLASKPAKKK